MHGSDKSPLSVSCEHCIPSTAPPAAAPSAAAVRRILSDVVGWLVINAMRSEAVQASLLAMQDLRPREPPRPSLCDGSVL